MTNQKFLEIIKLNSVNCKILERIPGLDIPDIWLVSGALFQTVWNHLTNKKIDYGIKDYDLFYFDDSDLSWEAEDKVIKRVESLFSDINASIEIRNQARVHIWYTKKFSTPYPPLKSATEGVDRFLAKACQVGVRISKHHKPEIYAPNGFDELENMIIRPNHTENFHIDPYRKKANDWKTKWPELKIFD